MKLRKNMKIWVEPGHLKARFWGYVEKYNKWSDFVTYSKTPTWLSDVILFGGCPMIVKTNQITLRGDK